MATEQSYLLDGPTEFFFPFPVRTPAQVVVSVQPGGVLPPASYEVIGYSSTAQGVTIRWDDAPRDGQSTLIISRRTELQRVSAFLDDLSITARGLNAEFDNIIQIVQDGFLSEYTGEWEPSRLYAALEIVTVPEKGIFVARISHESGSDFDTDLAEDRWTPLIELDADFADLVVIAQNLTGPNTIGTVAGIAGDVTTVAGNTANINTVAGISANVTTVAGIAGNVSAVAGNEANINAVEANETNINIVAGIDTEVTTVAGIASAVTAVVANETNINIVAADIADVSTVAGIAGDVSTVAGNTANINAVVTNESNINTVATDIAGVVTVAGIAGDVTAVATNNTNITAVAGNATNINTVAGISANVTTVAGISGNVTTVAGNTANINTVAGISADVTTVAGISGDVTAVAGNTANIDAVVANETNINLVAADIADISTVAGIAGDVTVVAANVVDVTNFGKVYLGPKTANPTLRNDGTALESGDLYFNTVVSELRVYDAGLDVWVAVAAGVAVSADQITYDNTASGLTASDVQAAVDEIASKDFFSITSTDISNWDAAFAWGDHAQAGYYSDTNPDGFISGITNESIKDLSDVSSGMTPTEGQVLTYDATAGEWYADDAQGGGGATGAGGDQVFVENDQVVTTSYTITANKNAMTTGPITIDDGVVVTVPDGSRWVVI